MMDIETNLKGDIPVIHLSGRILDGAPAERLQDAFRDVIQEGRIFSIIDLEQVTYFDSLAIGILVAHYISVTQRGGRVLLLKADNKIRVMMKMARLEDRFEWAADLDEALRMFRPPDLADRLVSP